jgi:hypothetical protein
MTAVPVTVGVGSSDVPEKWAAIDAAVPALAATMLAYLAQIAVSMRPSTVRSTEADLRIFAGFVIDHDPALCCVADIERSHVEAFKVLATSPTRSDRQAVQGDVVPSADVVVEDVLHPDHRMGMGRRPASGSDLLR